MPEKYDELKHKAIKGFFWRFGERISSQLVGFAVSVILARLLEPSEYGVIALTMVFMAIANCLSISGLGVSLIQKKDADEVDFSTIFYAGIVLSVVMYCLLYILAPYIGYLYGNEQVISVLRALGLTLPIASINSVQQAYVSRKMDFRKFFYATFIGTIVSGAVGIGMAYNGFGVWSLVGQQLSNILTNTLVLGVVVKWRPKLVFSWIRLKELYGFGVKLMGAQLLGTSFNELKSLVIGIKYKPADLAFFNRGDSIPNLIAGNINNTINTVLFPAMAKVQDDKKVVKIAIRRSMMTSSFIMVPMMFLLASVADKIVLILFTEKWLPCVPFMQVLCLNHCISILGTANLQTFNAMGRSDITFKLEVIKKPIFLLMIMYTMTISPLAIAIGNLFYGIVATAINMWPNRKIIDYKLLEQLSDVKNPFVISSLMFVVVSLLGTIQYNPYTILLVQIVVGLSFYFTISMLVASENFKYLITTIKSMRS